MCESDELLTETFSALLQAIATEQIPSIPHSLHILLLGQTESNLDEDLGDLKLVDQTVLQHVIKSNKKRERLLHEERTLSTALESVKDPISTVRAYRSIRHERLNHQMHQARQIQLRRSGARGAKARKTLLQLEEELKQSEVK